MLVKAALSTKPFGNEEQDQADDEKVSLGEKNDPQQIHPYRVCRGDQGGWPNGHGPQADHKPQKAHSQRRLQQVGLVSLGAKDIQAGLSQGGHPPIQHLTPKPVPPWPLHDICRHNLSFLFSWLLDNRPLVK